MSGDSVFVPISILTVAITLVNLIKYLRARDWNAVATLVAVFVVLFLVMWLYGNSNFGTGQVLPGTQLPLENMGLDDFLVAALAFTGPATYAWNLLGAIDNTRTTATPKLTTLPGATPTALPDPPKPPPKPR